MPRNDTCAPPTAVPTRTQTHPRAHPGAAATAGPDPAAVNAALICRDQMIGSVTMGRNGRGLRLLRGALAGRSQVDLAHEEGISPSAVSQRFRTDGIAALVEADELLGEVR